MFEKFFGPSKRTVEQAHKDNLRVTDLENENIKDQAWVDDYHSPKEDEDEFGEPVYIDHFSDEVENVERDIEDRTAEIKEITKGKYKAQ